ncbi:glycosyl transferase family 2 [Mycolicibacterium canariasense]|uniref:Glycosyl transferase family 2 n=1 Tax=Mycolicibacterium canariasense TaxID=228230 RepID=A0A100W8E0_MYCCR|nr:glycosyl transferase family 2 [Mycolicibacterium canariasense]
MAGILALVRVYGVDGGVGLTDLERCGNAVLTHDSGPSSMLVTDVLRHPPVSLVARLGPAVPRV